MSFKRLSLSAFLLCSASFGQIGPVTPSSGGGGAPSGAAGNPTSRLIWSPGTVVDGASNAYTFPLIGATLGGKLAFGSPVLPAKTSAIVSVSASGLVTLTVTNTSGGPITYAAGMIWTVGLTN